MPKESNILRACERELKKQGALYRKRHGTAFGTKGDPDLYLLWHGVHVEIELKRPGEDPTPLQRERLAEWEAYGAPTKVVHSVEELRSFLRILRLMLGPARPDPRMDDAALNAAQSQGQLWSMPRCPNCSVAGVWHRGEP